MLLAIRIFDVCHPVGTNSVAIQTFPESLDWFGILQVAALDAYFADVLIRRGFGVRRQDSGHIQFVLASELDRVRIPVPATPAVVVALATVRGPAVTRVRTVSLNWITLVFP